MNLFQKSLPFASLIMLAFIVVPEILLVSAQEPVLIAKKKKKRIKKGESTDVVVTEATVETRLIAGAPYHTLNGTLINKGTDSAQNISFYYEIYEAGTEEIIDAGALVVKPYLLRAGNSTTFRKGINAAGTARITLIQWEKGDRTKVKHPQMQLFSSDSLPSE